MNAFSFVATQNGHGYSFGRLSPAGCLMLHHWGTSEISMEAEPDTLWRLSVVKPPATHTCSNLHHQISEAMACRQRDSPSAGAREGAPRRNTRATSRLSGGKTAEDGVAWAGESCDPHSLLQRCFLHWGEDQANHFGGVGQLEGPKNCWQVTPETGKPRMGVPTQPERPIPQVGGSTYQNADLTTLYKPTLYKSLVQTFICKYNSNATARLS